MNVIEGQNVDLLTPFPPQEVKRLRGWMHCYKSYIIDDSFPTDEDEMLAMLSAHLAYPNVHSWGVIDKFNSIRSKHEAPLVGMIEFEMLSPWNGYIHVVSSRQSWGRGFIDEAGKMVLKEIFTSNPLLLRVSTTTLDKNAPAKALAKRIGFKFEGVYEDYIRQGGQPLAVAHFGLTKKRWEESLNAPSGDGNTLSD